MQTPASRNWRKMCCCRAGPDEHSRSSRLRSGSALRVSTLPVPTMISIVPTLSSQVFARGRGRMADVGVVVAVLGRQRSMPRHQSANCGLKMVQNQAMARQTGRVRI